MVDREAGLSSDLNTALIDEAQIVIDGGVHVSVVGSRCLVVDAPGQYVVQGVNSSSISTVTEETASQKVRCFKIPLEAS